MAFRYNRAMDIKLDFEDGRVRYGVIGKNSIRLKGEDVGRNGATARRGHVLTMEAADEVPLIVYDPDGRCAALLSYTKEQLLEELPKKEIRALAIKYGIDLTQLLVYIGPALTFSHVPVQREELLHVIEMGYRAAAKRTSGIDFLDLPVLAILELRAIGIPFENILPSGLDTFEGEAIFYSELRGDERKNQVHVEILG